MKIGMIFPGQGSQYVGMAKEFYDKERIVQEYFEQASNCLNQNFVKLCFASSEKELIETVNTQTSIFLVSCAIYSLLKEKYGCSATLVAGHSLGEYSAVFAAGGINFPDGLYLLKKRAQFMEEATLAIPGGMLAVLNFPPEKLDAIVKKYDNPESLQQVVQIVNYNSPRQLVVSGTLNELALVAQAVEDAGGRSIMLKVAGAFHSRLMAAAQSTFGLYMEKVDFHTLSIPLVNNIAAVEITSASDVRTSLIEQMSSPVLWWQAMDHFKNCDVIVEIGPESKLSGLLMREWKNKKIMSINNHRDIDLFRDYIALVEQS